MRTPVRGAVGESRVYVTDGSLADIGVAHHEGELPPPGTMVRVELASDWGPISVDAQVVRTESTPAQRPLLHSGLAIVTIDHQSKERLQTMIESASDDDF